MKYKIYKELSPELQEEYKYRFKERSPVFNVSGLFTSISVFIGLGLFYMMAFLLCMNYSQFEPAQESIMKMLTTVGQFTKPLLVLVIGGVLVEIVNIAVYLVSYSKWKKKNGIEEGFKWKKKC